jgi:DNA-binding transcriptional ArsR family regulator
MELDFDTVKALSSRTRIKILNEAMSHQPTPTQISDSIGRSKSTVSSHLKKLTEAGLLEKKEVEGRRRVVYKPTDKARSIVKGKDRKVKFSILSTVSTAWIGAALTLNSLNKNASSYQDSGGMGSMALYQGAEAATKANESLLTGLGLEDALLFAGIGFFSVSIIGLMYGLMMNQFREAELSN